MKLKVNGKSTEVDAEGDDVLLYILRETVGLTGTKYGCGIGACGSCMIHIDGVATKSCITRVRSARNKDITTIEGLANNGKLDRIQEEFVKTTAAQCGFCIPGIIMNVKEMLNKNKSISEEEMLTRLDQNLCRCGTHIRIIKAVKNALNGEDSR